MRLAWESRPLTAPNLELPNCHSQSDQEGEEDHQHGPHRRAIPGGKLAYPVARGIGLGMHRPALQEAQQIFRQLLGRRVPHDRPV